MNEPTLNTLTQRLDRLEREMTWWKALATAGVVILVSLLLLGTTHMRVSEEIRAKRFVLVDKDGKERATLVSGQPIEDLQFPAVLQFFDKKGRMVSRIGVLTGRDGKERGTFRLDAEDEKKSISMVSGTLSASDGEGLTMLSTRGLSVSDIPGGAATKSSGVNAIYSASGVSVHGSDATLASLSVIGDRADQAMLWLRGRRRTPLGVGGVTLTAHSDSSSSLSLGPKIPGGISLDVQKDGSPSLTLSDSTGRARAVLGEVELVTERTGKTDKLPPSSLVLFDKDGKVIWRAP